ncbi:MAG: helix-turn-helix transcriptional regulator [Anaerovoracaceae bacterium]
MPLNERIKRRREEIGLSQYALANRLKILNQSQISKIESGERGISAKDLILLSKALNVPISELLDEEEIT